MLSHNYSNYILHYIYALYFNLHLPTCKPSVWRQQVRYYSMCILLQSILVFNWVAPLHYFGRIYSYTNFLHVLQSCRYILQLWLAGMTIVVQTKALISYKLRHDSCRLVQKVIAVVMLVVQNYFHACIYTIAYLYICTRSYYQCIFVHLHSHLLPIILCMLQHIIGILILCLKIIKWSCIAIWPRSHYIVLLQTKTIYLYCHVSKHSTSANTKSNFWGIPTPPPVWQNTVPVYTLLKHSLGVRSSPFSEQKAWGVYVKKHQQAGTALCVTFSRKGCPLIVS